MIALLVAASAVRCALPAYCPSDDALEAAVRSNTDATIAAMMEEAVEANPGQMTTIHAKRIKRISNVYCGELLTDPPGSITCRLTVHYPSSRTYLVALLTRTGEGWSIDDQLGVTRRSGRRRR
jgi:hypothetical protein